MKHISKRNKKNEGVGQLKIWLYMTVEVLDDPEATISFVEIEADNWIDARKAKMLQSTGRKDGNSFDAVGIVKSKQIQKMNATFKE